MSTQNHGCSVGPLSLSIRTGRNEDLVLRLSGTFDLGGIPREELPRIRSEIQQELSSVLSGVISKMTEDRSTSTQRGSTSGGSSSTTAQESAVRLCSWKEHSTPSPPGTQESTPSLSTAAISQIVKRPLSIAVSPKSSTPPTTTTRPDSGHTWKPTGRFPISEWFD